MKSAKKIAIRKLKNIQALTPVLVVGLLIAGGAVIYNFAARAADAGFYLTSPATTYRVGESFNVGVYVNTDSDCANVVQADISYPAGQLRFNTFSATGSKFEASAPSDSSSGRLSVIQYTTRKECGSGATATSGVSGEQLIGTANFTVIGAGNAALNFLGSTTAVSASDNQTNVAPGSVGKSFVLTALPVTPGTPPPAPPTPPRPVTPTPPRYVPPKVTQVTPPNGDTPIQLEDNDVLEITDPIDVNPLPVQPDGVERIEYYLSGKLVATVKTPPYTFKLDSEKYLNGEYTLTTKTYYSNGQTKSVSQQIVVKNEFGINQVKLWIQKYAWLVILILLVIGAAIAAWIIHRQGKGPDNFYGDGSLDNAGDYVVSSGAFVTPDEGNTGTSKTSASAPTQGDPQVYQPVSSSGNKG